jgi:Protein of unknown function (DUF1569)
MLAHLCDGVRMAIGELPIKGKGPRFLRNPIVRRAIIYWLPFPKGAPTAPELLARPAETHRQEVEALKGLLETFAARAGSPRWAEHPAFGPLTERDWGALGYRHIDHHLRQFGA